MTRPSGAGRSTATRSSRAQQPTSQGCWSTRRASSAHTRVGAASSSAPHQPSGQVISAPGSAAPVRAMPAIQRAGQLASHARPTATGMATGAAASAAQPSSVAGATASWASRFAGTATRLTRAANTVTTGAHTSWAAAAADSASASRSGTRRRCSARLQRGASVSSAPVASTDSRKPKDRASVGSSSTSSRTAAARAGSSERRRPVAMASRAMPPHTEARSTLGPGRQRVMKPSTSTPPRIAVVRSGRRSKAASPPRSAREAVCGVPMSTIRMIERWAPLTTSRCVMSTACTAARSSGVSREVSPTTRAGSIARGSSGSPSVAVRSPARSRPAIRCAVSGPERRCGGAEASALSTAVNSPPRPSSGGTARAFTRSWEEGSRASQGSGCGAGTMTRTGLRTFVSRPSVVTTRVTRPVSMTGRGPPWGRGAASRGSLVSVSSAVTRAWRSASAGSGPERTAAVCRAATLAPATALSSARASVTAPKAPKPVGNGRAAGLRRPAGGGRSADGAKAAGGGTVMGVRRSASGAGARERRFRQADTNSAAARRQPATAIAATVAGSAPSASAAAAQADTAGGTSRRSGGDSCRGFAAPSRCPDAACTAARGRCSDGTASPPPDRGDTEAGARGLVVPAGTGAGGRVTGLLGAGCRRSAAPRCPAPPGAARRRRIRRCACGSR